MNVPVRVGGILEGSALSVSFKGVQALRGVDIVLGGAEILALVGPNGSGKTTCLNALTGFGELHGGSVSLDGKDITHLSVSRRVHLGIGRTFQNPRLGAFGLVDDVLQAGWHLHDGRGLGQAIMRPYKTRRIEQMVQREASEVLHRIGLGNVKLTTKVAALSQGQVKLLDVARALLGRPRVLLLDEPTSGLSPDEASEVARVISELSTEGISILLVEHDVGFVLRIAHRVAVLNVGEIVASGDPRETMSNPEVVRVYMGGVTDGVPITSASSEASIDGISD